MASSCVVYDDERCPHCEVVGTMGVAPVGDRRYSGGLVDERGVRHDPVRHEDGCPRALGLVVGWGEGDA